MRALTQKSSMSAALKSRLLLGACAGLVSAAIVGGVGLSAHAQSAGPVVAVTGGQVQGKALATGAVFKGIPFAAAPVGGLRWKEPQPVAAWTGVKTTTEFGHACAQSLAGWNKLAYDNSSEDCLYLNVWTPQLNAKTKAPVMVWIHGGGNSGGSAMGAGGIEPPFDGEKLSQKGVVVVSIHYRLGVFGFMGHPEATAESPHHASGGYGILDQVAALQWVHDNAAKFGGDPANVTVFGQSAGAQDTSILVASPLTRGLISKAIVESGSPMISDRKLTSAAETAQLGVVLAATLKAPATGQLAYMRGLSTQQILAAVPDYRKGLADAKLNMDVGIDGYAIPESPPSVYAAGRQAHIPMIIGNNGQDMPGLRAPPNATPEQINTLIKGRLEQIYGAYPDLLQKAVNAYATPSTYAPYGGPETQAGVDYSFRCTGAAVARWQSAVAPTYQYEFTADTAKHPPSHSGELDYIFGYLRERASDPVLTKLSDQMEQYWANFAKTGNPNGAGLPQWPRYDAAARQYMDLSTAGPVQKADLRGNACPLYFEKLTRDLASTKQAASAQPQLAQR